jgi:hypothetical protein
MEVELVRVDSEGRWQLETPDEYEMVRRIVREEIDVAMPRIVQALRADLLKRSRGAGLSRRRAQ